MQPIPAKAIAPITRATQAFCPLIAKDITYATTAICSILLLLSVPNVNAYTEQYKTSYLPVPPGAMGKLQLLETGNQESFELLVATGDTVYGFRKQNALWKSIWNNPTNEPIIALEKTRTANASRYYLATKRECYYADNAVQWERCGRLPDQSDIITITQAPRNNNRLIVNTTEHLWILNTENRSWQQIRLPLHLTPAETAICHREKRLIAIAAHRLFTVPLNSRMAPIKQLYRFRERKLQHDETTDSLPFIRPLIYSYPADLVLTLDGNKLISVALPNGNATQISIPSLRKNVDSIITAAQTAPLCFIQSGASLHIADLTQQSISRSMPSFFKSTPRDIAVQEKNGIILYAITAQTIVRKEFDANITQDARTTHKKQSKSSTAPSPPHIDSMPSIRQVQQAAIRYANLSNNIIKRWQRNARLQALLPQVDAGIEREMSETIELDRASTTIPDLFITGPRQHDFSWGIGLEWNLAELLWNDEATDIDQRKKYMIEMRENLISEVTTLYFERKRAIAERAAMDQHDTPAAGQLAITIDELTARIDGLTGGFISDYTAQR